jgi:Uma2 family endonuclease
MEPVFESVQTFSAAEFEQFVAQRESQGDVHHYELLHGRIVMNPPAGWPHGLVDNEFGARLREFVRARRLGLVFGSSQGFHLPSGDIVEPDTAFVSHPRWEAGPPPEQGRFLRVVPDLVAEITSPSNASRDRGEKLAIYERNRVLEYWLIDPLAQRITLLCAGPGDRFGAPRVHDTDEPVASALLAGFSVRLADLLSD